MIIKENEKIIINDNKRKWKDNNKLISIYLIYLYLNRI